jgi:hypothetical protein
VAFVAVITVIMLAGVGAIAAFVFNPTLRPTVTRGAIVGEHWHAKYSIHLCGKMLEPYPFVEGEIHSHGDGQVHLHPHTQALANENANFGAFLSAFETGILQDDDGKRTLFLPDGSRYRDGDTCVKDGPAYDLVVTLNGKTVTDDPMTVVLHEGDEIVVRFGPRATETTENPYRPPGTQQFQMPEGGFNPEGGAPPGEAPPGEAPPGEAPTGQDPGAG